MIIISNSCFQRKHIFTVICILLLSIVFFAGEIPVTVSAAAGVTIETTLTDGMTQKGSKKTFDVIARNSNNQKIASTVTLNGVNVPYNWDDTDKTSYTLEFTKEGQNTVEVSAGGSTKTYTIHYQKANQGDVIGKAACSIELFTIGNGYLVEPTMIDVMEGETAADALLKLLHQHGYVAYYGGSTKKAFYMAYIADGDKTDKEYNGYINSIEAIKAPGSPKKLNLSPEIPKVLYPHLESTMDFFDDQDYSNWEGYIGEFVFSNGSGWMYSINNVFPNVGFADSYLSDGDVMRVQFTLGYGADIGGASAMGGGIPGNDSEVSEFFKVANKDRLTKLVAEAEAKRNQSGIKSAYAEAVSSLQILDVSQQKVDQAYEKLLSVLNPKNPPEISPPTTDATAPTNSSNSTAPTNPSDSTQGAGGKGDSATPPSSADDPSASNIVTENPPSDDPGEAHETTVPDEEGNSNIKDLSSETSDNTELTDENTSSQGSNWQIWCIAGGCIVLIVAAVIAMFYLKKKKLLWWKE